VSKIREQIGMFRLHAKTPDYRRKERAMLSFLERRLDGSACVSFSAGKDSAVIAHACQAVRPDIPILMVDPGVPTHWEETERERWLAYAVENGWNLRLFPWEKWAGKTNQTSAEAYREAIHDDMFADLTKHRMEYALTTLVWGLRAAESKGRAAYMRYQGAVSKRKDGTLVLSPIADWSTNDVWAYIVSRNLPWLRIYDVLGPEARNGLVGRNAERYGRLAYLRQYFPKAYLWARDVAQLEFVQ
jgi:3'-phosphoadenosine 5'-phosphosulfate sulfotransferase (PAPS reductase)/FAD synthetase